MEHLSGVHWIITVAIVALVIYPYVRIIRHAGFSGWWILTAFVPVLNFIMLWVFAFVKWPAVDRG
ncbi:DUF805 domain-containing protein [Burkholderia alba]|uniref:hypothetical protein n=1 Tax=Burkholderia alba TaxID=2683677 RepID=UPI002B059473|nr:hypothetical protein [Burkholderia alba]